MRGMGDVDNRKIPFQEGNCVSSLIYSILRGKAWAYFLSIFACTPGDG